MNRKFMTEFGANALVLQSLTVGRFSSQTKPTALCRGRGIGRLSNGGDMPPVRLALPFRALISGTNASTSIAFGHHVHKEVAARHSFDGARKEPVRRGCDMFGKLMAQEWGWWRRVVLGGGGESCHLLRRTHLRFRMEAAVTVTVSPIVVGLGGRGGGC